MWKYSACKRPHLDVKYGMIPENNVHINSESIINVNIDITCTRISVNNVN